MLCFQKVYIPLQAKRRRSVVSKQSGTKTVHPAQDFVVGPLLPWKLFVGLFEASKVRRYLKALFIEMMCSSLRFYFFTIRSNIELSNTLEKLAICIGRYD